MSNMLLIGPTNKGKSMIIEKFRRQHLPTYSPGRRADYIPVIAMQMPSEPSTGRFYLTLLRTLNMPTLDYRASPTTEQVALRILKSVSPQALIIDEIHNLLNGTVA
jgi:stage III sporulation protein SpoIIIAA